jgi:pyridoxine/pyridoxamine 5'-phosphate oxidase
MCGDLWADVLQDIVLWSPDLDHLTVTMAFTCSKMRPDGFGGLAMLITASTIWSESTNTLFDRFYAEAQAKGEIGHGHS